MLGCLLMTGVSDAEPDYVAVMHAIADDIATIAADYPQLKEFSAADQDLESLRIDYAYHTHRSTLRAGWAAGAPEPDDDGIWFFIDFYDPGSGGQIDTQPVLPPLCLWEKRVTFLILEGKKTTSAAKRLRSILSSHGLRACSADG